MQFVVTPYREPGIASIEAAFDLFARMPDNRALRTLWNQWVHGGKLGKGADDLRHLGFFFDRMHCAKEKDLKQFDPVIEDFERYCRSLIRSGDPDKIREAELILRKAKFDAKMVPKLSNVLTRLLDLATEVIKDEISEPEPNRARTRGI